MNAAARKLVDQRFGAMRRVAEKALADAEVQENMAALAAAQATADALVIAHGIALGVIPVR